MKKRGIKISNAAKILFPDVALPKGELIDYYERISDRLLLHLKDRPLVVQRFPDGIHEEGFYQKQVDDYYPDWITTVRVDLVTDDQTQELVVCDSKATLIYLANQGCIAFHPRLSRTDKVENPDSLVIDLDPPGEDFEAVRGAALRVRDLLERELDLPCVPKLTGSKGIHVMVPLQRGHDFNTVRTFSREAMELLASRHPDELTTEQRKKKRRGRLYLDTGRNAYGQTAVARWSVRPLPGAPVAVPQTWDDLGREDIGPRDYTVKNVFRCLSQRDDTWAGLRRRAHSIRPARKRFFGLVVAIAGQHSSIEKVLHFDEVKRNFVRAAQHGLDAQLAWLSATS